MPSEGGLLLFDFGSREREKKKNLLKNSYDSRYNKFEIPPLDLRTLFFSFKLKILEEEEEVGQTRKSILLSNRVCVCV